ncbi:MAG: glycosyltransferase, partial [Bdellovibrionales bacterium]|nr:glycosyltransferase [Bdellovibrionales bacterium]
AYFQRFLRLPQRLTWKGLRWFHDPAARIMTRSLSMARKLKRKGFREVVEWNGSVDLNLFYPREKKLARHLRPIWLYVGRVSVEKNLEAFLDIDYGIGTKMVVGDGPQRTKLKAAYPEVIFTGSKSGEELAQLFSEGDVFVFPSKTDTFGRVMVEALACGVPIAAYPTIGPRDIVTAPHLGCLSRDLRYASFTALERGVPELCVEHAKNFSIPSVSRQFLANLVPV